MIQEKGHYLKDAVGIKRMAGLSDFVPFLGLTGKFHVALTVWRTRLKAGSGIVLTDTITDTWENKRQPYQIERSEVGRGCIYRSVRCRCCKGTSHSVHMGILAKLKTIKNVLVVITWF